MHISWVCSYFLNHSAHRQGAQGYCLFLGAPWQPGQLLGFLQLAGAGSERPLSLQAYNIHVNGVLHCRVRYSQLLGLHEQVRAHRAELLLPAPQPGSGCCWAPRGSGLQEALCSPC